MSYHHVQRGPFHYVVYATAAIILVASWAAHGQFAFQWVFLGAAAVVALLAASFHYMAVEDEGEALRVRFGPVPLLGTRIPYEQVVAVERGRTTVLDGWGVHWLPGRGWIYNIWGFDCVKVSLRRKTVRVGTDDVENLLAFLREKLGQGPAAGQSAAPEGAPSS